LAGLNFFTKRLAVLFSIFHETVHLFNYVENNTTGVALTVTQSGDIVSLDYAANEQGVNGTMTYSITYLA
jgi:hypothetical protein